MASSPDKEICPAMVNNNIIQSFCSFSVQDSTNDDDSISVRQTQTPGHLERQPTFLPLLPLPGRPTDATRVSPSGTLTTRDESAAIIDEILPNLIPQATAVMPLILDQAEPRRFRQFGGVHVPAPNRKYFSDLETATKAAFQDRTFWEEFFELTMSFRASKLTLAKELTQAAGGANIWLKREDLNMYGSHKVCSIIGQVLLARRMGKKKIVADCATANHGLACASVCARLEMACTIFMGVDDAVRQLPGVRRMKLLGAEVVQVQNTASTSSTTTTTTTTTTGCDSTVRVAINEAMRETMPHRRNNNNDDEDDDDDTYHLFGYPIGPHPMPQIIRTLQSVIGREVSLQLDEKVKTTPDAVIAAVGGGTGAVGLFYPFMVHPSVRLIAVEAAGAATMTTSPPSPSSPSSSSSSFSSSAPSSPSSHNLGIFHGARTFIMASHHHHHNQDTADAKSISPELSYPSVGPELAIWKDQEYVESDVATDEDAIHGLKVLAQYEGIVAGIDCAHAVKKTIQVAAQLGKGKDVVLLVTGADCLDLTEYGL